MATNTPVSPFYPTAFPHMPRIQGVRMATASAPVKAWDKDDILVVELVQNTSVAGVFTTSYTAGSNIEHCRSIISYGKARVLVVNSGNANVAVGKKGYEAVEEIVQLCAGRFKCLTDEVFFSATGVIGQPLPLGRIKPAILKAADDLNDEKWQEAAVAIMTTDTYPKVVTKKTTIAGSEVIINGICKGSGMIAPNMATMLAYVFTDANITSTVLQKALDEYVDVSFNSITVEGDTSTSDMLLMFATNQASHEQITSFDDQNLSEFKQTLREMLIEMAHLIVKDGEGAKKFITINVQNASSVASAKKLAFSIANSPLVKTAIAGEDANWGRIVMALGKAGEKFDKNKISIKVGTELIVKDGELNTDYKQQAVVDYMRQSNIYITADVSCGEQEATVWTCDLTHDFITINAEYLT